MGKWYYLNAAAEKIGPISDLTLKKLADNNVINQLTTLITEDGTQMIEAGSLVGLFPEEDLFSSGVHDRYVSLAPPPQKKESGIRQPAPPTPNSAALRPPMPPPAPWDSSAAIPVLPPVQAVNSPTPPTAWTSGVQFPTTWQSEGTPIDSGPLPPRRGGNFFGGLGSEFLIVLLFLSVVLKIARVAIALAPGFTTSVADLPNHQNVANFFSEDLAGDFSTAPRPAGLLPPKTFAPPVQRPAPDSLVQQPVLEPVPPSPNPSAFERVNMFGEVEEEPPQPVVEKKTTPLPGSFLEDRSYQPME